MAENLANRYAVPEVQNVVPLETKIANLRREVESTACRLMQRARLINAAAEGSSQFRLRFWEMKITQIRQAAMNNYNIQELRYLKRQTDTLSSEMEEFSKRLI